MMLCAEVSSVLNAGVARAECGSMEELVYLVEQGMSKMLLVQEV
jgi:hypothetical protein